MSTPLPPWKTKRGFNEKFVRGQRGGVDAWVEIPSTGGWDTPQGHGRPPYADWEDVLRQWVHEMHQWAEKVQVEMLALRQDVEKLKKEPRVQKEARVQK